jgi:hypothetical protein
MVDKAQLPHLIRLMDDESPSVREQVARELMALGREWDEALAEIQETLEPEQLPRFETLLSRRRRAEARRAAWHTWFDLPTRGAQLETAFDLLAQFQYEWVPPVRLAELLDDLESGYREVNGSDDPIALARYLFGAQKFSGDIEDYYNPLNSNLIHVIEERQGLPITLSSLYMLLAWRVGAPVEGVDAPGHFLTRAIVDDQNVYIDCFNGGRILEEEEVEQLKQRLLPAHQNILTQSPTPLAIVQRVLRNLISAYDMDQQIERSAEMRELLEQLPDLAEV